MPEAIKIKPAEFWLWADTVMLTLSAPSARIVYIYGRYANEHREAWPARETIAGQVGSSVRSVSRALSEAKAANLLTVRERKRGYLSPVYTLTLPDGVGLPARPKNREDRSVTPRGQICHVERTDLATNQNQEENHRREEREGSITQRPISDGAKAIGGAAAANINNEGQDMNSRQDMMDALNAPVSDDWPQSVVPEAFRFYLHEDKINAISLPAHRVAWKASNAEARHWPANWTPWLMQFLPWFTAAEHREWMTAVASMPNVPNMTWHHAVISRILNGESKPEYRAVPERPLPGRRKLSLAERAAQLDAEEEYR